MEDLSSKPKLSNKKLDMAMKSVAPALRNAKMEWLGLAGQQPSSRSSERRCFKGTDVCQSNWLAFLVVATSI